MKYLAVLFSAVALLVSSISSQQSWGWGSPFSAVITDSGLTITLPVSAWQRTDAPLDGQDKKMPAKRFPPTAKITLCLYYSYYDASQNVQRDERFFKSLLVDWSTNSITVPTGIKLPSTATFTIVGQVPGYNKAEGEAVFIRQEDSFACKDANGFPVYRCVADFPNKKVSTYRG